MNKNETKKELPYNADMIMLERILNDLKTSPKEGTNLETLWASIDATKDMRRSYTLNLAKYLDLIDTDNKKIWLTTTGSTLRYASKEEKNKILASKMPEAYRTMFKWIREAKELRSNEIKRKFIENLGDFSSPAVLDRVISTFLNYCDWLGIITYQGRGNQAKAIVTEFGNGVLEIQFENDVGHGSDEKQQTGAKPKQPNHENTVYPITITTDDRGDFVWDVRSQKDWNVIQTIIDSIKAGWEKTHPELKEDSSKEN